MKPGEVVLVSSWPPDPSELRLGPGALIRVLSSESTAQAVLADVGRDVDRDLTWQWPAPYDGEQRRARVRIRRKCQMLEELVVARAIEQLTGIRDV